MKFPPLAARSLHDNDRSDREHSVLSPSLGDARPGKGAGQPQPFVIPPAAARPVSGLRSEMPDVDL
jgi:hypothetical protein